MNIIKHLRRKNGINQSDLASAIGVSLRTIQLYEKRDANIPIKNLTKIAQYFNTTIAELYMHEVNESTTGYAKQKVVSADGTMAYALPDGKYLVMAPVLLSGFQDKFLQDLEVGDILKSGFLIDYFDEGGYLAFEIIGNAMNDGSIQSIPNGSLVLGKRIHEDMLLKSGANELVGQTLVLVCTTRIICKRFTGYNEITQAIVCNSLNDSPEYKDFEVPLTDIRSIYLVVKRQL